jgi:hypothetical protein
MIYAGDNFPLHPETNPLAAFDRLLNPADGAVDDDAARLQHQREQQALVDLLKGDLTRLRQRIGSEDYYKLDAHLEGLLTLERRLDAGPTAPPGTSCTLSDRLAATNGRGSDFPAEIRHMMDIAVAALSCDVTRTVSLQLSYAFSHVLHTWLGHTSDHHNMSHDGLDRRNELQQIDTWYAEQILYLLGRLDSMSEGDGTLLDNTLVIWGRELGSTAHRMDRVPFIMAGGSRGALQTGRYLDFDRQQHARLLTSVARLMGLDINGLGNREPSSGALAGIA